MNTSYFFARNLSFRTVPNYDSDFGDFGEPRDGDRRQEDRRQDEGAAA